jgi:uncharacterized protein YjeT (DUF2065 family)
MWHELLIAISLMLVIEGIWPFLNPEGMRRAMLMLADQDNHALRMAGLVSMVAGVVLLYLVN